MSWQDLQSVMHRVSDISAASAVLSWDQETYMPDGAVQARSEQLATLTELAHHYMTNDEAQRAISDFAGYSDTLTERQRRICRTFIKDFDRAKKLPAELLVEQARTASLGQDAWKKARQQNSFSLFKPLLERMYQLKREEALCLAPTEHLYDALLDVYEPGITVSALIPVFKELKAGTMDLLARIAPFQSRVSDEVLHKTFPGDKQLSVAQTIINSLGFSASTGRVDLSAHPFCTSFANTDVRLTTRIREKDLRSCLFGLIHEAGHGMYEQGISSELSRTPSGQGASMGIHESQSLFWENTIARSEEFWKWAFPSLRKAFPDQLAEQDVPMFFKAINSIKPSLNRVESDELTYNLHIILRFEFEKALIEGSMNVSDIPEAWNASMKDLLGVDVPNDAEGCLQDVHWSIGLMGYFPSYTLGKLYAAMLWNQMRQDIADIELKIEDGSFSDILSWLRSNIHDYGRTEDPREIIQRVCGRPLTEKDFVEYVGSKAQRVYGF
ncbi:MAG: carboxypeptidase M32 [Ignavibacteria bacterium]|nr:carboxypeptidase M32 [Ignavibacteria bacterium]